MPSDAKPTPGPWFCSQESIDPEWWIVTIKGGLVVANVNAHHCQEANARLIAEAGTVFHETGLTPRQLVERNTELVAALQFYAHRKNWRGNSILDMESSRFDGWSVARAALAAQSSEGCRHE